MTSSIAKLIIVVALMGMLSTACARPQMRDSYRERAAQRRAAAAERGQPRGSTRNEPVTLPAGAQVEHDLAYGPDPLQRLDVYRPANAPNAPVIFMVHGGGWRRGDKEAAGVVNNKVEYWLPKGYIVISVGYRLVPEATPLQQADDIAKALAFAQDRAQSWGGDPSRFVLMGHSAGAHLVSLVSADPAIASRSGARPWLGTVALDSGAYNVVEIMEQRHFSLYDEAFGSDRDLWREASPTLQLTRAPVPMLLVCSSRRADSCRQAEAFASKANSLGGKVRVMPIDLRHGNINAQLGTGGQLTSEVDGFLRSLGLR